MAWTFIDSMLIGQILMCVFGLYIAGLAASVARVPHAVMAALVLPLAGSPMHIMTRDEVIEMWNARQETLQELLQNL